MIPYSQYAPTHFDSQGLGLPDRQDWLVAPIHQNRDSDCLTQSNFAVGLDILDQTDPTGQDHELRRFGHWACGWFEIVLVRPDSECSKVAGELAQRLEDYPALNEHDWSEREAEAAHEVWRECYQSRERLEYIRKNRGQFNFRDLHDMLGCVRGKYFAGYASELLG